ncbi:MAG: hypothetical protein WDZ45_11255 [Flavobacteriaceae bacterium]
MKNLLSLFVLLSYSFFAFGQASVGASAGIEKKPFTTENFRLTTAIGYDLGFAGTKGETGLMNASGTPDDDSFFYSSIPNQTISLELDAYSPTSVIGFMGGVGINFQEYNITDANKTVSDSLKTTNIEIPLYVKARFGNALSRSHFWLAAGGGYSFTTKATLHQKNLTTGLVSDEVDAKDQFSSLPFLSAMVGYEFMAGNAEEKVNRDAVRFLLFAKVNYDLGSRVDDGALIANSALTTFQEPDYNFLRISFGAKILLRLSKAGALINESIQKSLNTN